MGRVGRIAPPSLVALAGLALLGAACGGAAAGSKDPLAPTGACVASATPTSDPPYAVTFQFRNNSAAPMFLLMNCGGYAFGVSSCASGFTDYLNDQAFCSCSCDNPRCGIACGGCAPDEGTQIVGGDSVRRPFDGHSTTARATASGSCVSTRTLPAGRYRVSIEVYDSATAAVARTGPRVVSRDFELPAPAGLVDVPLAP
jgi:hypothetical protein